jgi:hypothetical protein
MELQKKAEYVKPELVKGELLRDITAIVNSRFVNGNGLS